MSRIVIVYHSSYGHTARVAEALAAGAGGQLIRIDEEGNISEDAWATLNSADAIVFGSPTYMGNVSWQFKKFADASSKVWFTRGWQNKIFGGFVNSASLNGNKETALNTLQVLACQHGGLWVSLGLLPSSQKKAQRTDINSLGAAVGLMVQTPADASVDEMVEGDLKTAEAYGKRIAEITARFR